ncbi:MgtC/SapB family protein [Sphingobium sp.]|uniref:MgtC/SapB family protein n=1 Tax=Sphingobium sp. TaxID=1912891 RepID=UPI00257B0621|nr:MgtC/SapB family protein [Sphingobium sp.]
MFYLAVALKSYDAQATHSDSITTYLASCPADHVTAGSTVAMLQLEYLGLALALGLLIGVERGWAYREAEAGSRIAGIRTFGLIALAGGLAGLIGSTVHIALATILIAAVATLVVIGYRQSLANAPNVSATMAIVMLLTLSIGLLATIGQPVIASVTAAVVTLVLSLRRQLHGWLGRLSEIEVQAIARFALIALAILPLLPDRAMGPYEAWNPHQLWTMVVLVSGLSFLGYVASKRFGPSRGTIATAAAGAMVSSTAVTASLATRLRADEEAPGTLIAGIAASSAVMFLRVLLMVSVLAPFALRSLILIIGPAALISLIATWWSLRKVAGQQRAVEKQIALRNPFDLGPALILVAVVMFLSLIARWVLADFGDAGLATVLAISGMVDVDSAIITMGGLPPSSLAPVTAGLILAAPVLLNTVLKAGIAIGIAGWRRGLPAARPLLLSTAAALMMLPLLLIDVRLPF